MIDSRRGYNLSANPMDKSELEQVRLVCSLEHIVKANEDWKRMCRALLQLLDIANGEDF